MFIPDESKSATCPESCRSVNEPNDSIALAAHGWMPMSLLGPHVKAQLDRATIKTAALFAATVLARISPAAVTLTPP